MIQGQCLRFQRPSGRRSWTLPSPPAPAWASPPPRPASSCPSPRPPWPASLSSRTASPRPPLETPEEKNLWESAMRWRHCWASPGVCRASRSTCCRCCSRPGACEYPSRSDWSWKYQPEISSPHPTCLMPAALGFALETVLVESFSVRSKDLL